MLLAVKVERSYKKRRRISAIEILFINLLTNPSIAYLTSEKFVFKEYSNYGTNVRRIREMLLTPTSKLEAYVCSGFMSVVYWP